MADDYRARESPFVTVPRALLWAAPPAVVILSGAVGLLDDGPSPGRWAMLAAAGVIAGIPAVLATHREHVIEQEARAAEDLALQYETRLALALGDAVTPIAHLLGRMASGPAGERALVRGQLVQRIVDAAAELCGAERARAAFFEISGDAMRPVAWAGRGDAPTATFERGTPPGDVAHEIVARRAHLFVPDLADPPAGVEIGPHAEYSTFLSVAVYAGGDSFGLLTVDAVEVGDLDDGDVDVARALAQLLGVGLALR